MILAGFDPSSVKRLPRLGQGAQLLRDLRKTYDSTCASHMVALQIQPTWGMLTAMFETAFGHAEGCLVLFSHGHHASSEALCRTVIEASTNLYFCAVGNTEHKFASYFRHFLQEEREQNREWRTSAQASDLPKEIVRHHLERIDHKEVWLADREQFLLLCFEQIGVDFASAGPAWPSVFDRFKHLGQELTSRTVYAALCSQAHFDAEDLLNALVAGSAEDRLQWAQHKVENEQFALYLVLLSLKALIDASHVALARFLPISEDFRPLIENAIGLVQGIIQETPLRDWR